MAKDLSSIIKKIQNIMRKDKGVSGDAQRIDQLVWLLFLKVYDELKESNEYELEDFNYVSIIPEDYRWRNWAVDKKDGNAMTGDELIDFVNNKLFPTLKKLVVNENTPLKQAIVKFVFEDANNYMKEGVLLRQVINELNLINFDEYDDRHAFNDIYESILKDLQSAGNSGEFYTPRAITEFIVEMVKPTINDKVADFACGTGGFLTSTIDLLKKNDSQEMLEKIQKNIIGTELKPLPYILCVTNMLLHDLDGTNIIRGNSFSKKLEDYVEKDKVDCIVMNPPFGAMIMDGLETNFPLKYRTSESSDLFVALILYRLKQNGRVGVILPDSFLAGTETARVNIKEKLLKDCNLHTIIRLPNTCFAPYATVATSILFFDKTKSTDEVWYYEHQYPTQQKYSKTNPIKKEDFNPERLWWNNRTQNSHAWKVTRQEIVDKGYDMDFKNPTKKESVIDETPLNDYILQIENDIEDIVSSINKLKDLMKL